MPGAGRAECRCRLDRRPWEFPDVRATAQPYRPDRHRRLPRRRSACRARVGSEPAGAHARSGVPGREHDRLRRHLRGHRRRRPVLLGVRRGPRRLLRALRRPGRNLHPHEHPGPVLHASGRPLRRVARRRRCDRRGRHHAARGERPAVPGSQPGPGGADPHPRRHPDHHLGGHRLRPSRRSCASSTCPASSSASCRSRRLHASRPTGPDGVRFNLGFEAAAVAPNGQFLFVGAENALAQDGPAATLATRQPSAAAALPAGHGQRGPAVRLRDRPGRRGARAAGRSRSTGWWSCCR